MNKRIWLSIGIFSFLLIVFVLHSFLLGLASDYLIVDDPLKRTDILVVLSGVSTLHEGVKLYKSGYGAELVLVGRRIQWNTYEPDIMRGHAVSLGVPVKNISLITLIEPGDSWAEKTADLMKRKGFQSATIIANAYQSRRVKNQLEKIATKSGYTMDIHTVTTSQFDKTIWWKVPGQIELLIFEYVKLFCEWVI
jgi:hypothetical protein